MKIRITRFENKTDNSVFLFSKPETIVLAFNQKRSDLSFLNSDDTKMKSAQTIIRTSKSLTANKFTAPMISKQQAIKDIILYACKLQKLEKEELKLKEVKKGKIEKEIQELGILIEKFKLISGNMEEELHKIEIRSERKIEFMSASKLLSSKNNNRNFEREEKNEFYD